MVQRRGLMRDRPDERSAGVGIRVCRPVGELCWKVVLRGDNAHLVAGDASGDVLVEGDGVIAPVLMQDVEAEDFAIDREVVEGGHGVGVVAPSADHTAEFASDLLDDEVLLVDAGAETKPGAGDNIGSESQPRAWWDIPATASAARGCRRGTLNVCGCRSTFGCSRTAAAAKDGDFAPFFPMAFLDPAAVSGSITTDGG